MKILAITPGFLPTIGGAEIAAHEVYSRLAVNHQVSILTQKINKRRLPPDGKGTSPYTIYEYSDWMNLGRIPGRMLLRGTIPPFSLGATVAAIKAIRKIQPEIVIVHYAIYTGLAAVWSRSTAHIPTILWLVGRDAAPGPQVPELWTWYTSQIVRRVSHTIFVSNYCRNNYPDQTPCTIIPQGVDTRFIYPARPDPLLREKLGLPNDHRIIFSLQRLAPIKRVELQLQAVRLLQKSGFNNFTLLIGGAGLEKKRLEELSVEMGLSNCIRFLGFVPEPEIPRYFNLADLFLMTSAYETFGIVLAQALSAGLPVVAVNNTAIPEIVEHGKCGLLSPEGNPKLLTDNIRLLLESEQLRHDMSLKARSRAERLYNWVNIASQFNEILEKVDP